MVSIIVPIFNRENYLRRCIDSIVCQTYTNIEVILIDDGSTDSSGCICDEYANKDSRIRVLHQKNVGIAVSRIRGIGTALGDYIMFVDSDDWIEPSMVVCLLEEMQSSGADLVWCNFINYTPEPIVSDIAFVDNPSVMLDKIYKWEVPGYVWNKIYKTSILRDLEMTELDDMEDVFYTTQILANNPKMSFVGLALYNRDKTTPDALTKKRNFEVTCMPNYEKCYNYLLSHNLLTHYRNSLAKRVMKSKFLLLSQGHYKEAQSVLPFAHLNIRDYPVSFPFSLIYWLGFNTGVLGRAFLVVYKKLF